MFGSNTLSLPPPFQHDHRPQRLYSEPTRAQPSGQCHYLISHGGSKEQRCPCQGYQHNRTAPGSVCDCAHAACYHAQSTSSDVSMSRESSSIGSSSISSLLEKIRGLEEAVHCERELRENMMARERQSRERDIRVLKEALTPFYKTEQDMQQRLTEIEDKLDETIKEQSQISTRIANIEDANVTSSSRDHSLITNRTSVDQRARHPSSGLGPHDVPAMYSGSEDRTSLSAEPMSPRHSNNPVMEQESPRSSGILNLVEFPRHTITRHVLPPRLSPPAEPEEPRSSGFLALDMKDFIQHRRLAIGPPPSQTYGSPASSTKSPPLLTGRNMTPQSLPRVSPPNAHLNGSLTEFEDRVYKKRKHQTLPMALDVLADVSAASPVMS